MDSFIETLRDSITKFEVKDEVVVKELSNKIVVFLVDSDVNKISDPVELEDFELDEKEYDFTVSESLFERLPGKTVLKI